MKIYRYEHLDGGGPFVKPDGILRFGPKIKVEPLVSGAIYGCSSFEEIKKYFQGQEWVLKDCSLKIYDIPENNIIYQSKSECLFIPYV